MKNKVLFILSIPPPYGGGEIVSQFLYNGIKDDYYCVTYPWKYYAKTRSTHFNFMSYIYGIYYIIKNAWHILMIRPNAIYIGLPKTFLAFSRNSIVIYFAYLLKIKIFSELHGMSFPFANTLGIKRNLVVRTLQKISKLRVLSNSVGLYLKELGFNGEVYKINNGVYKPSVNELIKDDKTNKLNLIYLGAISKSKGFDRLLGIVKKLKSSPSEQNFHLNIIGGFVNSNESEEFIDYIQNNKLSEFITIHGHKIDQEKWDLVAKNQLLIHLTSFDGQPLTIIECMSLGIPTIATKVGGIPEMITNGKNGFLVNDDAEVIKIIENILSDKIDLERISQESIETFNKEYTVDKMVTGVIKMVEN